MTERLWRGALALAMGAVSLTALAGDGRFEPSQGSKEAQALLAELRGRVEAFQFGADTLELSRRLGQADPSFALGAYYQGVFEPDQKKGEQLRARADELAKQAPAGERRFIEAMSVINANNGQNAKDGIPLLEKLAADYPNERIVYVILGQLYQGNNLPDKARVVFERAEQLKPGSPRVRSFLANQDLLKGNYAKARETFAAIEKSLPKGSVPFAIRYGTAFSHLYEGHPDAAIDALKTYLAEYKDSGANQGFPEVFIWNSIARIHLEFGRPQQALEAYEKGYESVPGSSIDEEQKQTWFGRLRHGRARTLAKLGKHAEAWAEAETIKKMIEDGGEAGKQYWPAYHYVAGYVKLESGDAKAAVAHLKQANPQDPFHELLLARAYEKLGDAENAKKTYRVVVESTQNGIERALAYPEARKKLGLS